MNDEQKPRYLLYLIKMRLAIYMNISEMKEQYFYIEFEIISITRFENLQRMFNKLREVKNAWMQNYQSESDDLDFNDPVDDFPWRNYLDKEAHEWFDNDFDYESEEGKIYWQLWDLTEPKIRLEHPFFQTPGNWHFESMLECIFIGDYDLIDLIKEESNRGCLYYDPHGHPFGGSDSLIELIRSFGNQLIYDSWNEITSVRKSKWNYELAKKLVAQGIGFTP